jgi:PIN domain nuclease of toxin-antitoxin system
MVLDASALLALVNAEPGADLVAAALGGTAISAVNLAEIAGKPIDIGVPARGETESLVPVVVDFGPEFAHATAQLHQRLDP